mmetsp:Transcript_5472/g.16313  ORF Transcript_5472/g.16313 Transcript_5472/m.16313 type:complete len:271 (+) Transcript_5472:118-930(+)|eukprot:CAMPEP_0198736114 /NCGR_PEP_ID=MMETSP1475-20131203/63627_1 /TAXON_ID= ORGANISM="Unidentified sp., Strain CCMP1999" /NCGR_SAMPLE_ID=MMETSP1475 /ASSEMBLY_ACC=CAM_ASM_001111 /LENGTH=270 /DNA_ID=CAMNT_0044499875 /DNA_START=71 /DNA_END=883 /DNA_ORIENTATION=+
MATQKTTVFVGQIPYSASREDIQRHFAKLGSGGPIKVRMLTKKESGEFRGMAYVDLKSEADVEEALKMDYSVLKGRRLRVERTVGGGGDKRKKHLQKILSKDKEKRTTTIDEILKESLKASPDDDDKLKAEDIDEQAREFLMTIPVEVATRGIEELAQVSLKKTRNRRRYIMGVLKRVVNEMGQSAATNGKSKDRAEESKEDRAITVAKNYEDGSWQQATILKNIGEDKVLVQFTSSGREQEMLLEDVKSKTRRKRKARQDPLRPKRQRR